MTRSERVLATGRLRCFPDGRITHWKPFRLVHGKRADYPYGEQMGSAKLSNAQVAEIRTRYATEKTSQRRLAVEYGVSHTLIRHIVVRLRRATVAEGGNPAIYTRKGANGDSDGEV
jgi:hypothetical protein